LGVHQPEPGAEPGADPAPVSEPVPKPGAGPRHSGETRLKDQDQYQDTVKKGHIKRTRAGQSQEQYQDQVSVKLR
jgi:hypothetical protein